MFLGLAFLTLASCNKKEDSKNPVQNPTPQDQPKIEVASNDYKQMGDLNLLSTNQEVNRSLLRPIAQFPSCEVRKSG